MHCSFTPYNCGSDLTGLSLGVDSAGKNRTQRRPKSFVLLQMRTSLLCPSTGQIRHSQLTKIREPLCAIVHIAYLIWQKNLYGLSVNDILNERSCALQIMENKAMKKLVKVRNEEILLIEHRRAHNICIELAGVRMPFPDIKVFDHCTIAWGSSAISYASADVEPCRHRGCMGASGET